MNSTNIWKKILNDRNEKQSNKILNHHNFKPKKKNFLSNSIKRNLITNWILNEENDEENQSSIHFEILHKNSTSKSNDMDKDSLQIENFQYLSTMKNIIFLDLENFSRFFQHLTSNLPNKTYVIAFHSSNIQWKAPEKFLIEIFKKNKQMIFILLFFSSHFAYENLLTLNNFHLMRPAGNRHDAADFALVLTVIFS